MFKFSSDPYVAESQMNAIIYHLVAFAYIDSDFDESERQFIRKHVEKLIHSRAENALTNEEKLSEDVLKRWIAHFDEVLNDVDQRIAALFTESTGEGESTEQFVIAKLKLRCFELLKRFDAQSQEAILAVVKELMHADGIVHPQEQAFVDELIALVHHEEEIDIEELEIIDENEVVINNPHKPNIAMANHPFLIEQEWDFSRDPKVFAEQSEKDMQLVERTRQLLENERHKGANKLKNKKRVDEFEESTKFLDQHVALLRPPADQDVELLILGDLHGCYSCLKAALLQVDFFKKIQAHIDDPTKPPIYLVFLGDYIDRGRFSLSGTLRTAMQLYNKLPEYVYMLRGNHEYYVEYKGKVLAPVRPCEAMDSISAIAPNEVFANYMRLFDALPNMLFFNDILFVHGGMPRGDSLVKFSDLNSLNDYDTRFQMMWSDPSEADIIPLDLQKASARFPFGKKQFQHFMSMLGTKVMIRGHEVVHDGFKIVYDDPGARLMTLFSAGGAQNEDLPPQSNYRKVKPKALTIKYQSGIATFSPFEIDYHRFNDPKFNSFLS